MKHLSKAIRNLATITLIALTSNGAFATQPALLDDYPVVQQWAQSSDLETHPVISHELLLTELESNTLFILQAFHRSHPDHFYSHLAQLIIDQTNAGESLIIELLKPKLNLNKVQNQAFETLLMEQDATELAQWLQHYITLDKILIQDPDFCSNFFLLLTSMTSHQIQHLPEVTLLEYFKTAKEKRRSLSQCLAKRISLNIIDIDISRNNIVTSKILSPEKLETSPHPPIMEENSKEYLGELLQHHHNSEMPSIILLSTPNGSEYIAFQTDLKTELDNKMAQKAKQPHPERKEDSEDKKGLTRTKLTSGKPQHWMVPWIESPGYSIVSWAAAGAGLSAFIIWGPYGQANIFRYPPLF